MGSTPGKLYIDRRLYQTEFQITVRTHLRPHRLHVFFVCTFDVFDDRDQLGEAHLDIEEIRHA